MDKYESLKLDNQICFPFYAISKEIIRLYKPFLDEIDLTYTQYITMMVLWEEEKASVKAIGQRLHLDSGTLTPVLKKLEQKEYITRQRDANDERNVFITLTNKGSALKEQALDVPNKMAGCIPFTQEQAIQVKQALHLVIETLHL